MARQVGHGFAVQAALHTGLKRRCGRGGQLVGVVCHQPGAVVGGPFKGVQQKNLRVESAQPQGLGVAQGLRQGGCVRVHGHASGTGAHFERGQLLRCLIGLQRLDHVR